MLAREKLRLYRKRKDKSVVQLCNDLSISKAAFYKIESGELNLSYQILRRFADALPLSESEYLEICFLLANEKGKVEIPAEKTGTFGKRFLSALSLKVGDLKECDFEKMNQVLIHG